MNKLHLFKEWRSLVNITTEELEKILNSEIGRRLHIWFKDIEEQGFFSARNSAYALEKMLPTGEDFAAALNNWNTQKYKSIPLWRCAELQVKNIKEQIKKINGDEPCIGRLVMLKLWGHDLYRVVETPIRLPSISPETEIAFYNNPPENLDRRILLGSKLKP